MATKNAAPKRKTTAIKDRFTKTQIMSELAENTGLTKKEVASVLEELEVIIDRHIKKRAVGEFTLPGLLKITTVRKKAVKARKGINPFTGEETMFKAKPARTMVKIRPLKKLKDMVE
ncbi:MAG TPA: DNA-binding protein [Aeromonadales bacterium]|nr:DNA-binding protein [Aeromonadales bacterium]